MPQFYASTAKGLVEPLEQELIELGFNIEGKTVGGVFFDSNWEGAYRANLSSRMASRILKPILDFTAYQPEELYSQIQRHDFTKYIKPDQTISIDATVKDGMMRDQRFVAMKIKDAIVDQFRDKFGVRPSIDNENPDLNIHVRAIRNQFNVALDTSGSSLFMRGYRKEVGEAPLKENLAAGLVKLSGWDCETPMVDLMCGSGTILIEAAMMALKISPGIHRSKFGFQKWLTFDEAAWDRVVQAAMDAEIESDEIKFYGYDIDRKIIASAQENARRAGVDSVIQFKKETVATVEAPTEKGMVIVNPPYGARIGDEDNLRDVYRDLGFTLKHRFKGWDAWVLSGSKDLIMDLKLKSTRKIFVFNGNIECRFLKYSMF